MANVLEVKNLSKSFGELEVLKDISFNVEKGEVVDSLGSGRQEMLENIMNDIMFSL